MGPLTLGGPKRLVNGASCVEYGITSAQPSKRSHFNRDGVGPKPSILTPPLLESSDRGAQNHLAVGGPTKRSGAPVCAPQTWLKLKVSDSAPPRSALPPSVTLRILADLRLAPGSASPVRSSRDAGPVAPSHCSAALVSNSARHCTAWPLEQR